MEKPKKHIQYMDKDLDDFLLEYRKTHHVFVLCVGSCV